MTTNLSLIQEHLTLLRQFKNKRASVLVKTVDRLYNEFQQKLKIDYRLPGECKNWRWSLLDEAQTKEILTELNDYNIFSTTIAELFGEKCNKNYTLHCEEALSFYVVISKKALAEIEAAI
jgi:hypothetical protein